MTRYSEFRTAAMMLTALLRIRPKRQRENRRPKPPLHPDEYLKLLLKRQRR
jgi:hypothetical protein